MATIHDIEATLAARFPRETTRFHWGVLAKDVVLPALEEVSVALRNLDQDATATNNGDEVVLSVAVEGFEHAPSIVFNGKFDPVVITFGTTRQPVALEYLGSDVVLDYANQFLRGLYSVA